MRDRLYCMYIMMNEWNTVFYVGMSGRLPERVYEHKAKLIESFTKRYSITKLVYYECTEDVMAAIAREKQLKRWSRKKKITLIKKKNPGLRDLYKDIL